MTLDVQIHTEIINFHPLEKPALLLTPNCKSIKIQYLVLGIFTSQFHPCIHFTSSTLIGMLWNNNYPESEEAIKMDNIWRHIIKKRNDRTYYVCNGKILLE